MDPHHWSVNDSNCGSDSSLLLEVNGDEAGCVMSSIGVRTMVDSTGEDMAEDSREYVISCSSSESEFNEMVDFALSDTKVEAPIAIVGAALLFHAAGEGPMRRSIGREAALPEV